LPPGRLRQRSPAAAAESIEDAAALRDHDDPGDHDQAAEQLRRSTHAVRRTSMRTDPGLDRIVQLLADAARDRVRVSSGIELAGR
jgi:hypothetical protein